MSDNPYAVTPIATASFVDHPDDRSVDRQLLAPALGLSTKTGVLLTISVVISTIWAFFTLVGMIGFLWQSSNVGFVVSVVIGLVQTLAGSLMGIYNCYVIWVYRRALRRFLNVEIGWTEFALAHTTLWRAYAALAILSLVIVVGTRIVSIGWGR